MTARTGVVVAALFAALTSSPPRVYGQSACAAAAVSTRTLAAAMFAADPSDQMAIFRAMDKVMGIETSYLNQNPVLLVHSDQAVSILLMSPYRTLRFTMSETIRKREAISGIPVDDGVHIVVSPSQIGAPNIEKIVLDRDGREVKPTRITLAPAEFKTRLGATETINSGSVVFPCSAFAPGLVILTAIPTTGNNIVKVFSESELKSVK